MNKPHVNVTPLIDVLLVLLIIFMVVAPMKPSSFKARIPQEPTNDDRTDPNTNTLVATLARDGSLSLNREHDLGTVDDPSKLIERLRSAFAERIANGSVSTTYAEEPDRPIGDRIERTVFIKAPHAAGYGEVAKLVDAVKTAGAFPINLQIDDLQ
ncbi:MAG: biopolymer transporter ExbD [Acidobacteriota bacterium]